MMPRGWKMRCSTASTRSTMASGLCFSNSTAASPETSAASSGPPGDRNVCSIRRYRNATSETKRSQQYAHSAVMCTMILGSIVISGDLRSLCNATHLRGRRTSRTGKNRRDQRWSPRRDQTCPRPWARTAAGTAAPPAAVQRLLDAATATCDFACLHKERVQQRVSLSYAGPSKHLVEDAKAHAGDGVLLARRQRRLEGDAALLQHAQRHRHQNRLRCSARKTPVVVVDRWHFQSCSFAV